jgi:hypothetical protein
MYPRNPSASTLDAIRARIAGWILGKRVWTEMYRFQAEQAWKLGTQGRPLPWKWHVPDTSEEETP